ncbi:wd g-beta repeat-containing protein [Cyclospora cayetanensis]|uniref:Wd g-beta repeat-containing protein n=1 Tax=Cyclospora cayetanensis TaxID=88456 RepID=A0A1D3D4B6_9EIME|nr:wd g-beta repeat-containing protein [Cyclospora cayetanensis]
MGIHKKPLGGLPMQLNGESAAGGVVCLWKPRSTRVEVSLPLLPCGAVACAPASREESLEAELMGCLETQEVPLNPQTAFRCHCMRGSHGAPEDSRRRGDRTRVDCSKNLHKRLSFVRLAIAVNSRAATPLTAPVLARERPLEPAGCLWGFGRVGQPLLLLLEFMLQAGGRQQSNIMANPTAGMPAARAAAQSRRIVCGLVAIPPKLYKELPPMLLSFSVDGSICCWEQQHRGEASGSEAAAAVDQSGGSYAVHLLRFEDCILGVREAREDAASEDTEPTTLVKGHSLFSFRDPPSAVSVSPSGSVIAVACSRTLLLYSREQQQVLRLLHVDLLVQEEEEAAAGGLTPHGSNNKISNKSNNRNRHALLSQQEQEQHERRWPSKSSQKEVDFRCNVRSVVLHWHAHAVSSLAFSSDGLVLLSGGEEGVLVMWQLQQNFSKQFVPRLGAPILHISPAWIEVLGALPSRNVTIEQQQRMDLLAVCCADNCIRQRGGSRSDLLLLCSSESCLQAVDPRTGEEAFQLLLQQRLYTSRLDEDFGCTWTLQCVAADCCGSSIAAVQARELLQQMGPLSSSAGDSAPAREDPGSSSNSRSSCSCRGSRRCCSHYRGEHPLEPLQQSSGRCYSLSFWVWVESDSNDSGAEQQKAQLPGSSLGWRPEGKGSFVLLNEVEDAHVNDITAIHPHASEWNFRSLPVYACCLSRDGSLLAASHGPLISLWAPANPRLLEVLDLPSLPVRKRAATGSAEGSQLRLPLGKDSQDGATSVGQEATFSAHTAGWRAVHCKEVQMLENEQGLFLLAALEDRVLLFDLLRLALVWIQTFSGASRCALVTQCDARKSSFRWCIPAPRSSGPLPVQPLWLSVSRSQRPSMPPPLREPFIVCTPDASIGASSAVQPARQALAQFVQWREPDESILSGCFVKEATEQQSVLAVITAAFSLERIVFSVPGEGGAASQRRRTPAATMKPIEPYKAPPRRVLRELLLQDKQLEEAEEAEGPSAEQPPLSVAFSAAAAPRGTASFGTVQEELDIDCGAPPDAQLRSMLRAYTATAASSDGVPVFGATATAASAVGPPFSPKKGSQYPASLVPSRGPQTKALKALASLAAQSRERREGVH